MMTSKPRVMTIRVSISRDYGAETVAFAVEYEVTVSSQRQMDTEYAWATEKVYNQHDRHAKDFLPRVPNPHEPNLTSQPSLGEWVAAERIVTEISKGKRYYAVQGGRYKEHGVRIWEEVLKEYDLLTYAENSDTLPLEGWEMYVVQAEKGRKVAKLRKGNER